MKVYIFFTIVGIVTTLAVLIVVIIFIVKIIQRIHSFFQKLGGTGSSDINSQIRRSDLIIQNRPGNLTRNHLGNFPFEYEGSAEQKQYPHYFE